MLRISKVRDKKAENKRNKLKKGGASKDEVSKVKDNFSDALEYFFEKEFTQNNIPDHKKEYKNYLGEGMWNGDLSKELDINRVVKASDFSDLYNSIHPESKEKIAKDTKRGYIELIFNCPKDFSMVATLDEEVGALLMQAFEESIEETMQFINEKFNFGRVNNKNNLTKLNKLLYATFHHNTARPTTASDGSIERPDMQIHAHNLLWTTSVDEDGKFRAIEDYSIFRNQIYIGTFQRSRLAQKAMKLGFEIVPYVELIPDDFAEDGFIKIQSFAFKQITNEQRSSFSKRNIDIKELAKKYGVSSSICRDYIAQNFKHRKVKFDRDELIKIWREDAEKVGITTEFLKSLRTFNRSTILENIMSDEDLIRKSEIFDMGKKGRIYENNLMKVLCEYAQYVPIDPHQKLEQLLDDKLLIRTGKHTFIKTFLDNSKSFSEENFYTTKNANSKKDRQKFLGRYLFENKSSLLQSEIQHKNKVKELANGVQSINFNNVESSNNLLKVKDITAQVELKTQSVKPIISTISSFNTSIESIYASIEELQKQARKKGIGQAEIIKILAQIEKLRLQIDELEKQKKNQFKH